VNGASEDVVRGEEGWIGLWLQRVKKPSGVNDGSSRRSGCFGELRASGCQCEAEMD
jgi:hypothetical protein